ncbi:hypothetical protein AMAG_15995 [Allomyces macrogynus ATCC 38327]|uniref:Uncharacterized protein n=1 Tax=Allomyces macrogynus (strain ATCC 38327) TaxID=578462 RepID=A0A0L0TBI1_ALLM3|nr:hypothetical protein AMAG_15995 [Allomyces macrogynus ATCC 38327]|eukprot:KNE72055.1 hypothetical protein AMAG_15995 [Allomyces macrogynus ATCC 38327]
MDDTTDSAAAFIANRFTTATMEEKKVELQKFIRIKTARVEALRDELRAREDELALLCDQFNDLHRAELTEAWLTDPAATADDAGLAPAAEADAAAAAEEDAEELDDAYVPPVFPAHVRDEIHAEAEARARDRRLARNTPQVAPLPAEFADDRWLEAVRPAVHEAVEAVELKAVADAAEQVAHALVYGLNQLKQGWAKVERSHTYLLARTLTADTFLAVKADFDRLAAVAAGDLGLPESHGLVGGLTRVQAALALAVAHVAETPTAGVQEDAAAYRRAVVEAVDAIEAVAVAVGGALADWQAQTDLDIADALTA